MSHHPTNRQDSEGADEDGFIYLQHQDSNDEYGGSTSINDEQHFQDISSEQPTLILQSSSPPPPACLLYTSPSPRDKRQSRMPSSA